MSDSSEEAELALANELPAKKNVESPSCLGRGKRVKRKKMQDEFDEDQCQIEGRPNVSKVKYR